MPPISAVVFSVVLLATAAPAGVVIDLPDLVGDYEFDPSVAPDLGAPGVRATSFTISSDVVGAETFQLVVSGEWHAGLAGCSGVVGGVDESELLPPIAVVITSNAFPDDSWSSSIPMPDGPFDSLRADLASAWPPGTLTADQLIGVPLQAELFIDLALVGMCWTTQDTYGTLTSVRLEAVGAVATTPTTWSAVKALYR